MESYEMHLSLHPGHLEYEQKLKEVNPKRKGWKKEPYEQMSSACENHHRSAAEGPSLEINK